MRERRGRMFAYELKSKSAAAPALESPAPSAAGASSKQSLRPSQRPASPISALPLDASVPVLGADELDADDQPDAGVASADAGAASADAGAPAAPAGCGAPLSMVKVKSGALMGGKTMDDYYPDLVGSGRWAHGGTAGPFDTGSRVGSIVQLVGAIGAYCTSSTFNLEQTVTYKRLRRDGATDPREGKTLDDIGKSGRDASKAPFRQEWSGPAVFVSMADQPNISYGAATNAEWDREFTTSLVGPSGRTSVSWSTSIRITNGKVASNTVT